MNALRTPSSVFVDHAEDQRAQFPAHTFSPRWSPMPRKPGPIQLESRPMPANDRLWLHEDQCPAPAFPEPLQHDPEQFVGRGKSRQRMLDRKSVVEGKRV